MFKFIIDPINYEKINIFSRRGRNLLKKYIKNYKTGGSDLIDIIMGMGFTKEQAEMALEIANNDIELAMNILLSGEDMEESDKDTETKPVIGKVRLSDFEPIKLSDIELKEPKEHDNEDVINKMIEDKFPRDSLIWKDEVGDGNCLFRSISRQFFKADPDMTWEMYILNGGNEIEIRDLDWFNKDLPLHAVVRLLSADATKEYFKSQGIPLDEEYELLKNWKLDEGESLLPEESWGDVGLHGFLFCEKYLDGKLFVYKINCDEATKHFKLRKQQKIDLLLELEKDPSGLTVPELNKILLNEKCKLERNDLLKSETEDLPDFNTDIVVIYHYLKEFKKAKGEGVHFSSILKQDILDYNYNSLDDSEESDYFSGK